MLLVFRSLGGASWTKHPTDENPNKFRLSIRDSGLSHLTVIRTHTFWITSFPVLRRMIDDNKLCVKNYFHTLSCGFTLRFGSVAAEGQPASDASFARVLDAEKVGQLPIVRTVLDDEIRLLARLQ